MGTVIISDKVHGNAVKEDEVSISVQKVFGENDVLEHPDYRYDVCKGGYTAWKAELLS